jgi:hypothetical protein
MTARWIVEEPVTIEIDGSTLPDPETGAPLTAVLVSMPAYFADHLAQVLASWTTIGVLVTELSADESRMSETLGLAADAARNRDEASPELLLQYVRDLLAEYPHGTPGTA